jgi:hypothetical protein
VQSSNVLTLLFPPSSRRTSTTGFAEKEFDLFERQRVFKLQANPRSGVCPSKTDQVAGVPFLLVRLLWASKENEQYNNYLKRFIFLFKAEIAISSHFKYESSNKQNNVIDVSICEQT